MCSSYILRLKLRYFFTSSALSNLYFSAHSMLKFIELRVNREWGFQALFSDHFTLFYYLFFLFITLIKPFYEKKFYPGWQE